MLHEEERKERNHSKIFISYEHWVSFVSRSSHNIIANFTFIIIYNIVQHHLSYLTSFFSTSFQVIHAKIMTINSLFEVEASARLLIFWLIFRVIAFLHVSNSWILTWIIEILSMINVHDFNDIHHICKLYLTVFFYLSSLN